MGRRILAMSALAVVICHICACSGDSRQPPTSTPSTTVAVASSTTVTPTPTATPTPDPPSSQDLDELARKIASDEPEAIAEAVAVPSVIDEVDSVDNAIGGLEIDFTEGSFAALEPGVGQVFATTDGDEWIVYLVWDEGRWKIAATAPASADR